MNDNSATSRPVPPALLVALLALAITACTAPAPRVVVLIGVDTLAAGHLGVYGAERPTSPFLDQLAGEGMVFEHAYATSPWTLPSFASMFTGRLQSGHGAGIRLESTDAEWDDERVGLQSRVVLDPAVPTLAESLAAAGFTTLAVAQNPNLDPAFGVDRGFAVYDYVMGSHNDKRRADVVVDRALAMIDERPGEQLFLFVQFFDPHMAYGAPAPFGGMFTADLEGGYELPVAVDPRRLDREAPDLPEARRRFIAAAYDEEIRFVDSQIERFVDGLRQRGLWDESLVMFTADHGEELFEHDGFEHGHTLYEEVIRVPMIVWGPGVSAGRSADPVSIADVMPTALEALSLDVPEAIFGASMWPALRGGALPQRLIIAEGILYGAEMKAAIQWPHKIILEPAEAMQRIFDLRTDPGEHAALSDEDGLLAEIRDRLQLRLLAAAENATYGSRELDPELARRLRALGYIR